MGEAIGQVLALGVGVALSPIPVVAVVLMLVHAARRRQRAGVRGRVILGLAAIGVIVFAIAGPGDASESGEPATWVSVLKLVLGGLLLLVALRQWRGRPHEGDEAAMPKWMGALDGFGSAKALGAGVVLSAANPKNALLAVAAAAAVAQTGVSAGQQAVAYAVFVIIGTLGVGLPVVLYFALGERSAKLLDGLRAWMGRHNAAIMAVLCLIIGAKLIGDAITALTG